MLRIRRSYLYSGPFRKYLFMCLLAGATTAAAKAQSCTPVHGNFTVDQSQPTAGTNFQSFTEAVQYISTSCGIDGPVVFNAVAGTTPYLEQINIPVIPGASATNTVTFNGNGSTLQFASTSDAARAGIKLVGADYIIIDNFKIRPIVTDDPDIDYSYGYGIQLMNDADYNIIRNCDIEIASIYNWNQNVMGIIINGSNSAYPDTDPETGGFPPSLCDHNLITKNKIKGGYHGITISAFTGYVATPSPVYGNQIIDNTIIDFRNGGIDIGGPQPDLLIQGNDISGKNIDNYSTGININNDTSKGLVQNNRIHDFVPDPSMTLGSSRTGIAVSESKCSSGREITVANNLVYNFTGTEDIHGLQASTGNSYIKFLHNTVSFDETASTSTADAAGFYLSDAAEDHIQVENNIFSITRGGDGGKYGIQFSSATVTNIGIDHNDIYVASTSGTTGAGNLNGTVYTTLPDWQVASKYDYHSLGYNPMFTSIATNNYTFTNPLINNIGQYVDIDKDFIGTVRNTTHPDPGAYELTMAACTGTSGGTPTVLPSTTVCEGTLLTFGLDGNAAGEGESYVWQTSTTETGTYTSVTNASDNPFADITANTTLYYRAELTCGGATGYSSTVQITVTPANAGGTFTINSAQPTGNGNFKTFADAIASLECGIKAPVVFNVVPGSGPYEEMVTMPHVNGASAVNTITFNGNREVVSFHADVSAQRATIKFLNASHFILDSLHIIAEGLDDDDEYGIGVQLLSNSDSNIIRKCIIDVDPKASGSNFAGIAISSKANATASGSTITDCDGNLFNANTINGGYYGIAAFSPTSYPYIKNNSITNNTFLNQYSYGVFIAGTDSTLIEGNDISRPAITKSSNFSGIYLQNGSTNLVVNKNRVHNTFDKIPTSTSSQYGIYSVDCKGTATSPNTFTNNFFYNWTAKGPQYGIYNVSSDFCRYYHNTISLEDTTSTTTKTTRGFHQSSFADGLEFKNNNIVIRRGGTNTIYAIYLNEPTTVIKTDYNNFYIASLTATNHIGYLSSTDYNTLADWQTATTMETNSLAVNPEYKDLAMYDFTPTSKTLDNKGTPLGVRTDINNNKRSTTKPDIGAIEFSVCSIFPVANVVPAIDSICSGSAATFNIKDPGADTTYSWYDVPTDGTPLKDSIAFVTGSITTTTSYYVQATSADGCTDGNRTTVTAVPLEVLPTAPVVTVDSVSASMIRFTWTPVAGATGYLVTRDGINYVVPTSGSNGLTFTINGLNPLDTASIIVKALGYIDCQSTYSERVSGKTLSSVIYIPNTFTPNGDGKNDIFRVYGTTIGSARMMIFNQWGEKIYETSDGQKGWDGSYKGHQQPVGVYMYVINLVMTDGKTEVKKGGLNLVR